MFGIFFFISVCSAFNQVTIPVVFHLYENIPVDYAITAIQHANDVLSYSNASIILELEIVNTYQTEKWFKECTDYSVEEQMRYATAISPALYLNVWVCDLQVMGLTRYLPEDLIETSIWNGFTISYKGTAFTHEFGHYLGLLHTFGDGVNGCENGDGIEDTNPEKVPSTGLACFEDPIKSTCGLPDPVWNVMNYVDDACAREFTPGQVTRMHENLQHYKPRMYAQVEPLHCTSNYTICDTDCVHGYCLVNGQSSSCTCSNTRLLSCSVTFETGDFILSKNKCLQAYLNTTRWTSNCTGVFTRWEINNYIRSIATGKCLTPSLSLVSCYPESYSNWKFTRNKLYFAGKVFIQNTAQIKKSSCKRFKTRNTCLYAKIPCACTWNGKKCSD